MQYITVKQASERWGISDRRVRVLCVEGRIQGVVRKGRSYLIPKDTLKPIDGRSLRGKKIPEQYAVLFMSIDEMKAELDRRHPLTSGELKRLQDEFLVEFTYNSNAIEGNTLTLQETALALEGVTIDQKPLKDHLEAVGHRDAFLYVRLLFRDKVPISERVICEIHSLVLMNRPEDKGVYRRIPVKIIGAHHQPPQPYLVPVQMEQLIADLSHDNRHAIEMAALFHLNFEGIHPFIDGNGRTGRLILNLMLMQAGYPPIDVKFADRRKYYACFDSYYQDNDPSSMVNMVGQYVKERLSQYLSLLQN
ncbi:Fic family protein [Irregularibacter muris]|uniref:Fic family protein n=1 Tax=Irregularibacter muris TaxID=1796619 RepID=A0AAE3HE18_9FIRM|nr:DNA-binding protein [Irregularibacter muris]MCR1897484.1 Fic family protein [Irregularibacter muris]